MILTKASEARFADPCNICMSISGGVPANIFEWTYVEVLVDQRCDDQGKRSFGMTVEREGLLLLTPVRVGL